MAQAEQADALLLTPPMELLMRHLILPAFERAAKELKKSAGARPHHISWAPRHPMRVHATIDAEIRGDTEPADLA